MNIIERPSRVLPTLAELRRDVGAVYATNALVAFIFAATGPVAVVLAVGAKGGLSESDLSSWLFACFCVNGVLSIVFSAGYRQPLGFFWTIPGTVLVGPALLHLSFAEVIGAFVATGALLLVLGVSGWVRRGMEAIPQPIVMGMVAGVFLEFGVDLVRAFGEAFWLAAAMTAAFVVLSAAPRVAARAPPLVGALVVGLAVVWLGEGFSLAGGGAPVPRWPTLHAPAFSWAAMVELVVPLAITVLAAQNAQGFAILRGNGHDPPVNAMTAACGVGSLVAAPFGAVSTCVTGPVNAIMSGSGERARQYTSGVILGLLALLFGIFSPWFTRSMLATPSAFVAVLAGLAMLRVLQTAFQSAFQSTFHPGHSGSSAAAYPLGALVAFLVTVADMSIANVGAPFWALVFGIAASRVLERDAWRGGG